MATHSDLKSENVKEKGSHLFDATGEKAKELAAEFGKNAKNVSASAADGVSSAIQSLSGTMKKYPLPTFFVGLGLGALIGLSATALKKNK